MNQNPKTALASSFIDVKLNRFDVLLNQQDFNLISFNSSDFDDFHLKFEQPNEIKEEVDNFHSWSSTNEHLPELNEFLSTSILENSFKLNELTVEDNVSSSNIFEKTLELEDSAGKIEKVWQCGECKRDFKHQYLLLRHLPTHTNVRNYVCKHCGKAFRQLSTLNNHQAAIHSVVRPYSCKVCAKSFNRVSTLISHTKTHSAIKAFVCPHCPKGFHQKGNLRNHIYVHTNERPYRCKLCNKGFNQLSNLECHKKKNHLNMSSWKCAYCNALFTHKNELRFHELEHRSKLLPSNDIQHNKFLKMEPVCKLIKENQIDFVPRYDRNNGICLPAITTVEMRNALERHQTPFALVHFYRSDSAIMRIVQCDNKGTNFLCLATKDDFDMIKSQSNGQSSNIQIVADIFETRTGKDLLSSHFVVVRPKRNIDIMKNPRLAKQFRQNGGQQNVLRDQNRININIPPNIKPDPDVSVFQSKWGTSNFSRSFGPPSIYTRVESNYLNHFSTSKMMDSKDQLIKLNTKVPFWSQFEGSVKQEDSEKYLMEDVSVGDAIKNYATGNLLSPSRTPQPVPIAADCSSGYNNNFMAINLVQEDAIPEDIPPNVEPEIDPRTISRDSINNFIAAIISAGCEPDYVKIENFFNGNISLFSD